MKLPVNETIKTIFGDDIVAPAKENGAEADTLTLATVIQNALLNPLRGDESLDGARKLEMHRLAVKTLDPDADYKVEEVTTIKERVGRAYGPVVVGPAWQMIEGAAEPSANA